MKGQILFWGPLDPMVDRGLNFLSNLAETGAEAPLGS